MSSVKADQGKRLVMTTQYMIKPPFTHAVRKALQGVSDSAVEADLLFLEAWEIHPSSNLGMTLRAGQIRRANPDLAAAIDAELKAGSWADRRKGLDGAARTAPDGSLKH